jgi:hypothetical protein
MISRLRAAPGIGTELAAGCHTGALRGRGPHLDPRGRLRAEPEMHSAGPDASARACGTEDPPNADYYLATDCDIFGSNDVFVSCVLPAKR